MMKLKSLIFAICLIIPGIFTSVNGVFAQSVVGQHVFSNYRSQVYEKNDQ